MNVYKWTGEGVLKSSLTLILSQFLSLSHLLYPVSTQWELSRSFPIKVLRLFKNKKQSENKILLLFFMLCYNTGVSFVFPPVVSPI